MKRFLEAQENNYSIALKEIKAGKKESHWMWYIFPQMKGLGLSATSRYYAIESIEEARKFLEHPILGERLRKVTELLLHLIENDAINIFGYVDSMKLQSSMTLFACAENQRDSVFQKVLNKFFEGEVDGQTLDLLKK
ncbi:DUF1810 domain-containing protein [Capnocytophaga canimorsus]|uniref:DUF1810 domain-containing protein n=1 Tax=Capnocytophaga canimorsus TaxID=28188 RepID=UPI003858F81C